MCCTAVSGAHLLVVIVWRIPLGQPCLSLSVLADIRLGNVLCSRVDTHLDQDKLDHPSCELDSEALVQLSGCRCNCLSTSGGLSTPGPELMCDALTKSPKQVTEVVELTTSAVARVGHCAPSHASGRNQIRSHGTR